MRARSTFTEPIEQIFIPQNSIWKHILHLQIIKWSLAKSNDTFYLIYKEKTIQFIIDYINTHKNNSVIVKSNENTTNCQRINKTL
jgi:hypothetical protein